MVLFVLEPGSVAGARRRRHSGTRRREPAGAAASAVSRSDETCHRSDEASGRCDEVLRPRAWLAAGRS